MKQITRFEQDADGWWASRTLGEDDVLGHGGSKEEAVLDLDRQIIGFLDFLKRTGRSVSETQEVVTN